MSTGVAWDSGRWTARWWTLSLALSLGLGLGLGCGTAAWAQPAAGGRSGDAGTRRIVLLVPADDPRLDRSRLERAMPGHPSGPAADAVRMALQDADPLLRQAQLKINLEVVEVADAVAAREAAARLSRASAGGTLPVALIADLDAPGVRAVAEATGLPVLNIAATEDDLRQAQCRTNLWHLVPSDRMRSDAIAQALVARRWTRVLLLIPQDAAQAARVASAQGAIKRYGLKLVDTRTYKLSADPRERDRANPRLLTQGDYDAVWVVDADGEFSSTLPYRTVLPRPVVGDGGLMAAAWSPKFDRFGAPQVSRRLSRQFPGRRMGAHDWGAWMAGKAAVALALQPTAVAGSPGSLRLESLELDGSKGITLSFRDWDGQLRQPLLLTDGQSVMDLVPNDGVMHPRNRLDTLGADAPENLCRERGR